MIRFILIVLSAAMLAYVGATVKMGNRTLFGHIRAVWATPEAQDMKKGVEQSAKPMLQKVKRGVEAGYREATKDDGVNAPAPKPETKPAVSDAPQAEQAPAADAAPVDAGAPAPKKHRRHTH